MFNVRVSVCMLMRSFLLFPRPSVRLVNVQMDVQCVRMATCDTDRRRETIMDFGYITQSLKPSALAPLPSPPSLYQLGTLVCASVCRFVNFEV